MEIFAATFERSAVSLRCSRDDETIMSCLAIALAELGWISRVARPRALLTIIMTTNGKTTTTSAVCHGGLDIILL